MTPEEIPQRLIDILDNRAGKIHSRTGSVVGCLAEILTEYEKMRLTCEPTRSYKIEMELTPPEAQTILNYIKLEPRLQVPHELKELVEALNRVAGKPQ